VRLVKREDGLEVWLTEGPITHKPVDRIALNSPCSEENPGGDIIIGSAASWLADGVILVSMVTTDCAEGFNDSTNGYLLRLDANPVSLLPLGGLPDHFSTEGVEMEGDYFLLDSRRLVHTHEGLVPVERGTVFVGWLGGAPNP
jgi:hypothetical protein